MKNISRKKNKRFITLLLMAASVCLLFFRIRQSINQVRALSWKSSGLARPPVTSDLASARVNPGPIKVAVDVDREGEEKVDSASTESNATCRQMNFHASYGAFSHINATKTRCSYILALTKLTSKPNMQNTWRCTDLKKTADRKCLAYAFGISHDKALVDEIDRVIGCKVFCSNTVLPSDGDDVDLYNLGFSVTRNSNAKIDPYLKIFHKLCQSDVISGLQKMAELKQEPTDKKQSQMVMVELLECVLLQPMAKADANSQPKIVIIRWMNKFI
ncbi:uncharacterized protein LOC119583928 [Penaeus monodon]|uniref:uncharacterized protein LOC119583928 n=1 Tax=Penaeus monodon TaxID=6687 RepID=UPI0018A73D46|nr:uncharacterized protein LOC119583928 [Penaeus monodon]